MNSDQKTIEHKTKMPQGRLAGVYLRGFTLLEIIISVGILSVVVVAAIGITLSIKVAQEKMANIQDVQDNIRYALEFMAKEMRQGSTYEPQPAGCALGTNSPCVGMKFMRGSGVVWYCLVNNTIYRYMGVYDLCNMSDALALTSDNIEVTNLNFYVLGNLPGPADGQPRVTVAITANSRDPRIQLRSPFHLQTTVTQRRRDGVARPSPVGFWKFDDGSGLTALDSSGNGNTGTLVSGPAWTVGQIGGALQFDGFDDYTLINSTFGLGNTNLTIAGWAKPNSAFEGGAFVKVGNETSGSGGDGFAIGIGNTNFDSNGNNFIVLYEGVRWISSGVNFGTGWHHFALVVDSTGEPSIYLDGALVYSDTGTSANLIGSLGAADTQIGGYTSATPSERYINAMIDEVRIYNQALTQKQIQDIMVSP